MAEMTLNHDILQHAIGACFLVCATMVILALIFTIHRSCVITERERTKRAAIENDCDPDDTETYEDE